MFQKVLKEDLYVTKLLVCESIYRLSHAIITSAATGLNLCSLLYIDHHFHHVEQFFRILPSFVSFLFVCFILFSHSWSTYFIILFLPVDNFLSPFAPHLLTETNQLSLMSYYYIVFFFAIFIRHVFNSSTTIISLNRHENFVHA